MPLASSGWTEDRPSPMPTMPPTPELLNADPVLSSAWPQVLERIGQIHGKAAHIWLKPEKVRPVVVVSGELVLACPNVLFSKTIADRMGADLCAVVSELLGIPVDRVRGHVGRDDLARHEAEVVHATVPAAQVKPRTWGHGFKALGQFVVGSANRVAYDAITDLVRDPNSSVNPVFIHGKSGLGKTHLLQGLALAYADRHPSAKVAYLRCEQFTNEWLDALKTGNEAMRAFRVRMRHPELLLVDDLHFLAQVTRTSAVKELYETFNALHDQGKKVVFTSDASPKDITYMESNFVSRFIGGLVIELKRPDPELRRAVAVRKAEGLGMPLPSDVAGWMADQFVDNIRELEGAVNKLAATARSFGRVVDLPFAKESLRDLLQRADGVDLADVVLREVADRFGVEPAEIMGKGRAGPVCSARHLAMYVLRMAAGGTYASVGRTFGKGHPAVVYACGQAREMGQLDPALKQFVDELLERLRPH